MRRPVRAVSGLSCANTIRCALVIVAALLLAPSSRAQSLPVIDSASDAQSLPATAAASLPPSLPASTPGTPASEPLSQEPWWQRVKWSTLGAGALCSGTGLAGLLAAASYIGFSMVGYGWLAPLAPCSMLLAPIAISFGALLDAERTGRAWWPAVVGATAGWLFSLVALIGVGVAVFATDPFHLRNSGKSVGIFFEMTPVVRQALSAVLVSLALSPLAAPASLGGALLADLVFQPKTDVSASPPVTTGLE